MTDPSKTMTPEAIATRLTLEHYSGDDWCDLIVAGMAIAHEIRAAENRSAERVRDLEETLDLCIRDRIVWCVACHPSPEIGELPGYTFTPATTRVAWSSCEVRVCDAHVDKARKWAAIDGSGDRTNNPHVERSPGPQLTAAEAISEEREKLIERVRIERVRAARAAKPDG